MTPEFLRRYYILRIISTPYSYGIDLNGFVPLVNLQNALEQKRDEFADNKFYEKLVSHSPKTIKRDIKAIESYFDVEIKLKRNYGYYIKSFEQTKDLREIFDKTELFLLNQKSSEWKNYITTESSSLNSSIDISSLINAIDQKLMVQVTYDGWYDDNRFQRYEGYVQPLHIKEANRAWYLIAHNSKIGIYSFSLDDRIKALLVSTKKVVNPIYFNEYKYFNDSIGILKDETISQKIILEVANHHFKYLLSKPLHHSQKVISYPILPETTTLDYRNPNIWGKIEVYLQPNYEFMMEILKFNRWMKVVSPKHIVDDFVELLDYMRDYYV